MRKILLPALLLAAALTACTNAPEPAPTAAPTPTVTPTPTSTPSPTPSAEATPVPIPEPTELWGFPIDDTHDAFEVDTKGKLGTVLVTVETREIEEREPEWLPCHETIRVWTLSDLTEPIQTIEKDVAVFDPGLIDANFDGHPDIDYVWFRAATNFNHSLLTWDEKAGQFVYKGDFSGYGLIIEEETQTLYEYNHGSAVAGIHSIYRWEDGELVCARTVNVNMDGWDLAVCDRVDGELTEVYRETFGPPEDDGPIYDEAVKWLDLSYHG